MNFNPWNHEDPNQINFYPLATTWYPLTDITIHFTDQYWHEDWPSLFLYKCLSHEKEFYPACTFARISMCLCTVRRTGEGSHETSLAGDRCPKTISAHDVQRRPGQGPRNDELVHLALQTIWITCHTGLSHQWKVGAQTRFSWFWIPRLAENRTIGPESD